MGMGLGWRTGALYPPVAKGYSLLYPTSHAHYSSIPICPPIPGPDQSVRKERVWSLFAVLARESPLYVVYRGPHLNRQIYTWSHLAGAMGPTYRGESSPYLGWWDMGFVYQNTIVYTLPIQ